jgi:hypothetical protein
MCFIPCPTHVVDLRQLHVSWVIRSRPDRWYKKVILIGVTVACIVELSGLVLPEERRHPVDWTQAGQIAIFGDFLVSQNLISHFLSLQSKARPVKNGTRGVDIGGKSSRDSFTL